MFIPVLFWFQGGWSVFFGNQLIVLFNKFFKYTCMFEQTIYFKLLDLES